MLQAQSAPMRISNISFVVQHNGLPLPEDLKEFASLDSLFADSSIKKVTISTIIIISSSSTVNFLGTAPLQSLYII